MKRILIIGGVIIAIVALIVFNKMTSKKSSLNTFTEVKKGLFEITVSNSGELIAEKSIDIKGPEINPGSERVFQGMNHRRQFVRQRQLWIKQNGHSIRK